MSIVELIIMLTLTGIAIDFGRRIIMYARTGDTGYKHKHFYKWSRKR